MLAVVVSYTGHRYLPLGDYAVIDSRVRDVWSTNIPMLGMYSRFGWYHPGPAMFWSVAPFSLIAGKAAWGTLVGCALIQGGAVVWSARVAWRLGGLLLVLATLAVQALSYAGIAEFLPLQRPWNPNVAFPFLPLFLLLVWSAGLGDFRQIPWVVLVGSFLVQTHSGYALMVAAGLGWMVFFIVRRRKDPELLSTWRRSAVITGVVLAVMWVAPLYQQVRHLRSGNVVRLAEFFVLGDSSRTFIKQAGTKPVGFPLAPQVFAAEFHWLPPWLGGHALVGAEARTFAAPASLAYLLVPAVLVLVGLVASLRAHKRSAVHAVILSTLFVAAGIFSLSRVSGGLTDFVFYWRISLAVVIVVVGLGAVLISVPLWRHRAVRVATGVVLAVAVVIPTTAMTSHVIDGDPTLRTGSRVATSLIRQLDPEAKQSGPVLLLTTEVGVQLAVFDELNRRGRPVYVHQRFADRYFEGRHQPTRAPNSVWLLVRGVEVSRAAAYPQAREVASYSPLSPAREARVRELQATLTEQLRAAGQFRLAPALDYPRLGRPETLEELKGVPGLDQGLVRELMTAEQTGLLEQGLRYGVFAFPPSDVPEDFLVT